MPKALRLHSYNGINGLQLDNIPLTDPQKDQVRIKVEAFSLNYGDFDLMENKYVFSMDLPARIGDEAVGVIDALGPDVENFKIGDRVSSLPWMNEGFGVNGEFAIIPEHFVAKYPKKLRPAQACSIWVPYLTAYYALFELGQLYSKDFILLTAASSSAALAAREMAQMVGAKTIGTTRSRDNTDFLLECGYDHIVVTNEENLSEKIMQFTKGKGVRIIYDPVGGYFMQTYAKGLAQEAIIFLYGGMDGRPSIIPEIEMTQKAAILRPYSVYNHIYNKEQRDKGLKFVFEAIERGDLNPRIDKVFQFDQYLEAYTYQKEAKNRKGKVVVKCNS